VQIYKCQEDPNIKVNEVYEFVGVLSCDPAAESETKAEAPGMLCAVEGAQFTSVYFSFLASLAQKYIY
jgi:hypothetical protein